jgi:hypothetical protein
MSTGVFAVVCPNCDRTLPMQDADHDPCLGCGTTYITRSGYLVVPPGHVGVTPPARMPRRLEVAPS